MSIFDIISLLGGLSLFLYGMRTMSSKLKEESSGALKRILGKVTDNPVKAFLLGVAVTALIQSSTATIVITSGLVAAGLIEFRQSIGIIMGANVGTTVTGQIIRLLDIDSSSASWLRIFKPSTLAPVSLIIGIVLIMFLKLKNSEKIGGIFMGFGMLFTGLMNMTSSVSSLSESGMFEKLFAGLGRNPLIGYATGAGVATLLQSSSATIGILQAFATTGQLTFKSIYAVLVGIYLGDCLTTALVCSIGAKTEARRVGMANILFNLFKTVLVFAGIAIARSAGWLDALWDAPVTSGIIANTNTVFNLGCSLLLFPFSRLFVKATSAIVKDRQADSDRDRYSELVAALNPVFFNTPALAFSSCYNALLEMFRLSTDNIRNAIGCIFEYDAKKIEEINRNEDYVDMLTDKVSEYLVALSTHITSEDHVSILDHYYKVVTEFERLSDHAVNISETAAAVNGSHVSFSETALGEIKILGEIINEILDFSEQAFKKRDVEAAKHIEPLEEVVDDMVNALTDNHLVRMRRGECNVLTDVSFTNLMSDLERISDVCSNIGVATVARVERGLAGQSHEYMSTLHSGHDEKFNSEYSEAHDRYFGKLSGFIGSQTAGNG